MKILSVDYGSKRVGVASGDSVNKIAFPKTVLKGGDDEMVMKRLLDICSEEGYEVVVFGLPLDMSDEKGEQYQVVDGFVNGFRKEVGNRGVEIEVETVDERLSSFEADQYLDDFKGAKVRKKDGDRDMLAAKVILERWFARG
jgi:putative holliday junction resolvase